MRSGGTRRALAILVVVAGSSWLATIAAAPCLRAIGASVVEEDPEGPADLVVVSNAAVKAGALEAVRLWHAGLAGRIVVAPWLPEPLDARLEAMGVHPERPEDLAEAVLRAGGVPADRIVRLPAPSDGTRAEAAALATLLQGQPPGHVLFLTARSHTARARWLLRRALPAHDVRVRSAAGDRFDPGAWWHERVQARELAMEYLRWATSLVNPGVSGGGVRAGAALPPGRRAWYRTVPAAVPRSCAGGTAADEEES